MANQLMVTRSVMKELKLPQYSKIETARVQRALKQLRTASISSLQNRGIIKLLSSVDNTDLFLYRAGKNLRLIFTYNQESSRVLVHEVYDDTKISELKTERVGI